MSARIGLRVLVCGGRKYEESVIVFAVLDWFRERWGIAAIVEGGASGADRMARAWAGSRSVPCQTFDADWRLGRVAGPIRNQRMVDEGELEFVIAFPGGAGTADMVARARRHGLRVMELPG